MKKSKLLVALLAAIALLASLAACSITEVEAIRFINAPDATYSVGDKISAGDFKLEITYDNDNKREVALNDSILSVSGLVDGMLDTTTSGEKTIVVSYRGVTISVYYTVVGKGGSEITPIAPTAGDGTTAGTAYEIATPGNLAWIHSSADEKMVYYKLTADIDLAGYEWVPLGDIKAVTVNKVVVVADDSPATTTDDADLPNGFTFIHNIVLDGDDHTISNLNITAAGTANNFGLFATLDDSTVKNIKFVNPYIDMTSTILGESCKNAGVIAGTLTGASVVDTVTVEGAFLRGNGRVAGIAGQMNHSAKVTGTTISDSRIVANNPVSAASADGEGDKIGGIVGQVQTKNTAAGNEGLITVENCTVQNVVLSATRDVGGVVGFAGLEMNLTGNKVIGCTIGATVAGGVREDVGTRNAGGIVGTLSTAGPVHWSTNTVEKTTITASTLYESVSTGTYVGGIRRDGYASGKTTPLPIDKVIEIGEAKLTIKGVNVDEVNFAAFVKWHKTAVEEVNAWIGGETHANDTIEAPAEE